MKRVTIVVPDDKRNAVLAAIRHNGGFVLRSCMVSNGWQITYTADPR